MRIPIVSKTLAVPFSFLVAPLFASAQDLQITEFAADNTAEVLVDEDGDASDWIEVFNPGTSATSLAGFFLSDDEEDPDAWAFPARSIGAGEYLVIFASSKDRGPLTGNLHTNFRLSAGGEALLLSRDTGGGELEVVSSFLPEYPNQREGISYGVGSDGSTLSFFETPTPGAANNASFLGFVSDTRFSIDRGFFDQPFDLEITTDTPGATIRYTIDGSVPTETNGTDYTGPFTISKTTTLRAAAFLDGFQSTNTDTQTYLFLSDIRTQFADGSAPDGWPSRTMNGQQYDYGMDPDITSQFTAAQLDEALTAIPSMCISISQEDLTSTASGIYSNPDMRGREWERPGSLELIDPDGFGGFQTGAGFRVRGGASRATNNPKHAFRIFFRSEYGAGSLDYPLFGTEGATTFEKIDLRTAQNYSWSFAGDSQNTFLREVFARDLQRETGNVYTKSRYLHLYINGVYWGLFMTQERAEADFGETYLGGDADSFDTLKSTGNIGRNDPLNYTTEATDGFLETIPQDGGGDINSDWKNLWDLSRAQQANPTLARYYEMQGLDANGVRDPSLPVLLDVDNLIDYMLIIGYTGNYDGPLSAFVSGQGSNNWYGVRDRDRDDKGFAFFVHDAEHSLGAGDKWDANNDRMNTTNSNGFRNDFARSNPQFTHFDLAESTEEYRVRFGDRAQKYLFNNGLLTDDSALAILEERRQIVDKVIDIEAARWGDSKQATPFDRSDWEAEVRSLQADIRRRDTRFLRHLQQADVYPTVGAPEIEPFGGLLPEDGKATLSASNGTTLYYTTDGSDPRLVGGALSPQAISGGEEIEITMGTSTRIMVRGLDDDGDWSAVVVTDFTTGIPASAANIVVSEINYHPASLSAAEENSSLVGDEDDFEFIEIANIADVPVDLSGVMISREDLGGQLEGVEDPISTGSLIAPGGRVLIVADRDAFAVRYPLVPDALIVGDYSGRLDNGRDTVLVLAADGSQIARVRYDDEDPWPASADGTGATLNLTDVDAGLDENLAESWTASAISGGSPGTIGTDVLFTGDPEADLDEDGVPALLEFVYGSSDQVAGDAPPLQVFPPSLGEGVLDVIVTRDANADGVYIFPEISTDLFAESWSPASNKTSVIARLVSDDGETATEVYRVSFPASIGVKRGFLRMRAEMTR